MHFFRKLSGKENEWFFSNGEKRVIWDGISLGYNYSKEPLKKIKEWSIEDTDILEYELRDLTTPEDWLLDFNKYQHCFTALKPGRTFAICGYTKRRVLVIVGDTQTFSYLGALNTMLEPTVRLLHLLARR